MCGISGLIDLAGLSANEAQSRSQAALEVIRFRGPDGEGTWNDGHCALVHTRLAIIDLSPLGAQPMARDGLVITFNGEIFNYADVRAELARLGHSFRSNSDTEVLLEACALWVWNGRASVPSGCSRLPVGSFGAYAYARARPSGHQAALLRGFA